MNLSKFAENLKYLMEENAVTQTKLAKELNLETSSICRYLQENCEPSTLSLIAIADYFKCPVDFLIGLTEYYTPREYMKCGNLGLRIKELATKEDKTGYKFCKAMKISHDITYYRWVNGQRQPSIDFIIKIANYLNCSVDCVLGREK